MYGGSPSARAAASVCMEGPVRGARVCAAGPVCRARVLASHSRHGRSSESFRTLAIGRLRSQNACYRETKKSERLLLGDIGRHRETRET